MAVVNGAMQQTSASPSANDDDSTGDIPRRPMRVKVLYTFDDQNKSNCLARLPNALSIPVVSLDEDTQIGVIELKTCIQAIAAASPELTAKLGHDYTVYAYDFSEYETPLVGQGMLSWILASASPTPNAPAEDSQSMVTGRVCKNILGLFSNGIKETLEVKLKLVPVPRYLQKEYVENMERYHSLSQIMPEGFDYNAWSDFLKENPTLGQLAQPRPNNPANDSHRLSTGGYEPFHQMLTRHSPSQEPLQNDSFYKQSTNSFMSQHSRASSPANSIASFRHIPYNPEPRPSSRASVRSDASTHTRQCQPDPQYIIEIQDDGPPRKRARITQATRPRNTPLTARNDSLHKTAATASSVWLHRPIAASAASNLADAEMHPRAPTPRPGNRAFGTREPRRLPAPSVLRHSSMDAGRPYISPYDTGAFSTAAADSCDDERDGSPDGTPRDIPSSPPILSRHNSPTPSSPPLPTFPQLTDSGFVSDVPMTREDDNVEQGSTVPDGSDPPTRSTSGAKPNGTTKRRNQLARMEITPYDNSHKPWQEVTPGPSDLLPQSYVPPSRSFTREPYKKVAQSIESETAQTNPARSVASKAYAPGLPRSQTLQERARQPFTDSFPFPPVEQAQAPAKPGSPDSIMSQGSPESDAGVQVYSREATPNAPAKRSKASKPRGMPRSQTWSGAGEPMSDAPTPSEGGELEAPRSGSHAKRKKYIKDKLEKAVATGDMPDHCHNCGEIETPTWRRPYTRIEYGTPEGIVISPTGIVAYEVIETDPEHGGKPMYRIYRNKITPEEKAAKFYEPMNLCNPCGLWLVKNAKSRPQHMWDKSSKGAKAAKNRKRQPSTRSKSMCQGGDIASDAVVPPSDAVGPESQVEKDMPPPSTAPRASSIAANDHIQNRDEVHTNVEAEAALQRAIQSSPAGFRRTKDSSVDVDHDLTPRPTRRLLFPSPRKNGAAKSLELSEANSPTNEAVNEKERGPEGARCERCKKLKKSCDRQRPCRRCVSSGLDIDDCIPATMDAPVYNRAPTVPIDPAILAQEEAAPAPLQATSAQGDQTAPMSIDDGDIDKENCPPPAQDDVLDDIAYLFETTGPAKTTPKKSTPKRDDLFQDLLKTPTPGSRRRLLLTPRRRADGGNELLTPSRCIFTPRTMRPATAAPETPFTRQLNQMLSDAANSSPSQGIDLSAFPVFDTPGRPGGAQFSDLFNDDFLSSDMPASSSPARGGMFGLGFDLYEDPNTSSVGMWNDPNMFSSDTIMLDVDNDAMGDSDSTDGTKTPAMLKMTVGGITVDFASMIEEVVNNDENTNVFESFPNEAETQLSPETTKSQSNTTQTSLEVTSPDATSQSLVQTPEAPEV
ncbi:uncharacterized protein M421DRAFT_421498 [Didymella exigua CBS 183.55]|uniref:Zn(2)-C6 fungal-type domain-containing protein n=1 Tax=Didymella exigua CBS 183.55 TaxID=1150837 RepID=A0A6A5RJ50_9PLEO|nr:uncharacterized protein M421DRAFT_421498 [Didymella exigua CBS 183.55]KAF1927659.1 hypothetical protein M421DRAFT_421498 [Didymella exigua CBS 183.55]